jgi:hypothetical protein
MSASPQNNVDNQEIDLSQISKKIGSFLSVVSDSIFKGILFVQKRLILFIGLFIIGYALGYFLDTLGRVYKSEVIVSPNFGSVDYLYAKVDLLESKLREQDTMFFKSIGIQKPQVIGQIEVKPIVDIYSFVASNTANVGNAQNTQNFELIKLLSEDGDVNKVITDEITSKNYGRHTLIITTKATISNKGVIEPLLAYLNQSDYYQNCQKTYIENVKIKMKQNEIMIEQINGLLNQFSATSANNQKSDKLVYYNENTQLNAIIQTKNGLITELGGQRMDLITVDKVIKKSSSALNVINTKGLNNKMKFAIPLFLIFAFIGLYLFRGFYKSHSSKLSTK